MPCPTLTIEEHELPSIEALLAGTLALMTGYSQALQAALEPQRRLNLGLKVGANLALLADHPQLSAGFRRVLHGLCGRWHAMSDCTAHAVGGGAAAAGTATPAVAGAFAFRVAAPERLQ